MNNTQTQTTAMPIVAFLAGLLAGKGVFGFDTATWTLILGSVGGLIATVWGAFATRQSAIVQTALQTDKTTLVTAVANSPEVKQVILDPNVPGSKALDSATPNNVVTK